MPVTVPTLLVYDVGLTHAKAVLFRADGALLDAAAQPIATQRPTPDAAEQDPEAWWQGIRVATRELIHREPDQMAAVAGIGVTAHMHALVCVDKRGSWLGPAMVLGDRRAVAEARDITAHLGERAIYDATGTTMDASMPAAKIRWLLDHDPDRARSTALFTSAKDVLRGRLTGDRLSEPIDACASSLWDIHEGRWSEPLLEVTGIEASRLPQIVDPEALAGVLQPDAARDLGLVPGVPVVVGAGDDIEVLGCGLTTPGAGLEHLGTTGSILAVTDDPAGDPTMALELYPHALPGRWVLGGSMTAAGAALAWLADLMVGVSAESLLSSLKGADATAAPLFLPSLAGERCPVRDPQARGALVGIDLGTTRETIARAVFTGVTWSLTRILERIEQVVGRLDHLVVSSGRLGSDEAWARHRATTYGRTLRILPGSEPTATGVAILAAVAVGAASDVTGAIDRFVPATSDVVEIGPGSDGAAPASAGHADLAGRLAGLWPIVRSLTGDTQAT